MSNQIVITSGAKLRDLDDVIIGTDGILSSVAFNVANGVPRLDEDGKILVSQLPNSVMEFKGVWNAATNTPTLVNGTGNAGDVWLCNVAGTVNFGAGPIVFAVGDYAVYTGEFWARSSGATGTVTSVGVSRDGNALTISGSPVTSAGTINLGFSGDNTQYINGAGNLTTFPTVINSIGLTMPAAFGVSNSPLTANGTIGVTALGYPSQYIRGDGTLADFPTSGGGGSSVSYYLNGGTSQGVIGGVTYYEMSKTADTGTGVDFSKSGDGFITAFLTDAGDPALLQIPAGNWNYEIYASMSSNGGTPEMYAELYVYDGTTFTLLSTSVHEILYDGVNLNLYTFAMAVPETVLTVTDRLAIKLYATNSGGKTTTIHTQDSHLCQVITTFTTGLTALNGLTSQVQYFGTGTSGNDFNIVSSVSTHTFNIPSASATARGLITTGTQTIAGSKTITGTTTFTGGPILSDTNLTYANSGYTLVLQSPTLSVNRTVTLPNGTGTLALTSDISYPVTSVFGRTGAVVATSGDYTTAQVTESGNLYFTDARARTAISLTTTGSTGAATYNNTTGVLNIPNYADQYVGTVTSVGLSAPTGFSVSGSPVTSSGTLALAFATGYSLPTNVKQSNWDDAYTWVAAFPTQTGNTGKFLTTDGSTLSWAANPLGTVTSVAMTVPTGLSISGSPITTSGTLAVTFASGYSIPTTASQTNWDTAYTNRITSATLPLSITSNVISIAQSSATVNGYLSSMDWSTFNGKQNAITLTTTGSSGAATLIGSTLNIPNYGSALSGYVPYTGATTNVALGSNTLQVNEKIGTFDNKGIYLRGIADSTHKIYYSTTGYNNAIWEFNSSIYFQFYNTASPVTRFTFATNGDFTAVGALSASNFSGSSSGTNTGDQTLAGLGGVPTSRTLTINGVGYDLSADRSWTITAGVTGSGTATRVAFWDTTGSITSSSGFYWDNVNGRLAVGKNTADSRLEVYGGTKGQIRANGGPAMGAGLDLYTELSGTDRRNWSIVTESYIDGDLEILRSGGAGGTPTVRTFSLVNSGEGKIFNHFNIINATTSGIGLYLDNSARTSGRNWSILNGNTAVGEFSIKDETGAATRFKIGTDGVVTSFISALIGIATDATNYMRISENQIWRTGSGTLYINNSGTGQVVIAGGGGAITLGTDTQQGSYYITTKNMGITANNFYFGTGQVRIGGGSDHTTNTVLSVAPGVIQFDRPGIAGGAFQINSDGNASMGGSLTLGNGLVTSAVNAGTPYNLTLGTSGADAGSVTITAGSTSGYNASIYVGAGSATVDPNTIVFNTASVQRIKVYASGNTALWYKVGINGSTPDLALTVNQRATGVNQGIPATSGTTQNGILRLTPATGLYGETLDFGMNVGPTYGWIQATNTGALGTNYTLALNPNGGQVFIGTTTALQSTERLAVLSDTNSAILAKFTGGATSGWGAKIWNNGATGDNNILEFLTETAITARGSVKYDRTNDALLLSGSNALNIATNGTTAVYVTASQKVGIGGTSNTLRMTVNDTGSTITGGDVTFATQAKGLEIWNTTSAVTNNLVGVWFSTGPHKTGIASGRTDAATNWAVDLRFFTHYATTSNLDHTYETMRLGGDGTLTVTGDVVAYGSPSDLRLKTIKEKVPNALESILKLNGYRFDWKKTDHLRNYKEDIGVIAQEVAELFPELARTNIDGNMSVRYQGLTAVLIEAIKEQQKQIDELKNKK